MYMYNGYWQNRPGYSSASAGYQDNQGNYRLDTYPGNYRDPYSGNRYTGQVDFGPNPFVINIEDAVKSNSAFRVAIWTGNHLQVTLNSIDVGEDIGLEIHPNLDQFIRIEQGQGMILMGDRPDYLSFQRWVYPDYAIIIPAGTWHNIINTGHVPLKLYSIYAPPQHRAGTVHLTRADAMAAE